MVYFADTNILLRFLTRSDPDYTVIRAAARIIKTRGDEIVTSAQNIAEFWGVLTRPASARGGYGLSIPWNHYRHTARDHAKIGAFF